MNLSRESKVERPACKKIEEWLLTPSIKIKQKGYPDRLFLCWGGVSVFIEFKREGEKPSPLQAAIHQNLRSRGYIVETCDNEEEAFNVVFSALGTVATTKARKKVLERAALRGPFARPRRG